MPVYPQYPTRRENEERFLLFYLNQSKSMGKILRQIVGIDVAQDELVVSLGRKYEDLRDEIYAHRKFINNPKGFIELIKWVKKLTIETLDVGYVMEATGVYHESLVYYLNDNHLEVSVVLPNLISNFFRTLDVKTINDKTSSSAIARFGLARTLNKWQRPDPVYKKLKQLSRERDQIIIERTAVKNQLHAENAEAEPNKSSVKRSEKHIAFLSKHEKEIMIELAAIIKNDNRIKQDVALLSTIPGVGKLTAAIVLAETNGFELIRNKSQLVSYAGLDVVEKQSGTSIRGKTRISKRGNRHLRKALHMPSLSGIRREAKFKALFVRLVSRHGIKMKAVVAVQKKMLELMYTLYKTQKVYNKDYVGRNEQISLKAA
jgi:transposase